MSLDAPASVMRRLEAIESDLASRQNSWEEAAQEWFVQKREKEKKRAEAFLAAEGTVAERTAIAEKATADIGSTAEAEYEAQKAVIKVLEARANIGLGLLKAMGRA